jgi:hypothetical protein
VERELMAASLCDGSYSFWHQGLGLTALGKTSAIDGGDYTYWLQGMGLLRLLGASVPALVPAITSTEFVMPIRRRSVVAYGSY